MPIVNHVVLASGAVVAVSVAVATVMAIYESPELRQYAEDVRRRIAVAIYSMSDGINSPADRPRFNRPEDAEGFSQSRHGEGAEPGVDADEESRRKQREELLYWNSVRLEKLEREREREQEQEQEREKAVATHGLLRPGLSRESTFDDFLQPDESAEHGTFVFNSGAELMGGHNGLRRRGEGSRGFTTSLYTSPFADEHHIDNDDLEEDMARQIAPAKADAMSDIYSATTRDPEECRTSTLEPSSPLVDAALASAVALLPATLERELADNEFISANQEDRHASIQAWARDSSSDFYSPLPMTPVAPVSEPDMISEGQLTPTDSISLIGSGEDIANDGMISDRDVNGRYYDVISESEGMATPASWSEVGSVVSESDAPLHS